VAGNPQIEEGAVDTFDALFDQHFFHFPVVAIDDLESLPDAGIPAHTLSLPDGIRIPVEGEDSHVAA